MHLRLRWLQSGKKQTKTGRSSCDKKQYQKLLSLWIPRTEILILLVGLVCTVCGKFIIIQAQNPSNLFTELIRVTFPDIFFFSSVILLIRCLYTLKPSALTARCALVLSVFAAGWSLLNLCWLTKSGVQLQPGILMIFIRDFAELWPIVKQHLGGHFKQIILLAIAALGACLFLLWRFLRPDKVIPARVHHARWAAVTALIIAVLFLAQPDFQPNTNSSLAGEVLEFSSHWHALASTIPGFIKASRFTMQTANVYQVGQRQLQPPKTSADDLPNVVLLLLEGVSYPLTSLSKANLDTTPYLARLANEGVEFRTTLVPVPYTTKAFWAALTSTTPVIQTDCSEAIPAQPPYEGLPSILARIGYRSAFFEMSKGSFKCAPGFFSNLAFDWAWFRENLEDTSAYLGYMNGDDCRMIEPAFEWVRKESKPFLLTMITSVAHDPYEVPRWFGVPKKDPYEKHLQTIRYTDYFLEQFCRKLEEYCLDKNTILCMMGDHGTSFRVNRAKGRWIPYEEVIRVPWVIHWPGQLEAGRVIKWPCSQMDITPTILKLIGFDISQAGFEGINALAPAPSNRRLYFSSLLPESPIGFAEANRKIVYWPSSDKIFEYDLTNDPKEENPKIIPSQTDIAEQIKRDINNWQKKTHIEVNARRHTKRLLYSHWQTFSVGRAAWAYYVP